MKKHYTPKFPLICGDNIIVSLKEFNSLEMYITNHIADCQKFPNNQRHVNHFYLLNKRLQNGNALTKKMNENLGAMLYQLRSDKFKYGRRKK